MTYANDQWLPMPVKDLYDTLVMAMAINAAKDMYDKRERQLDNFYKQYSDFYTPIAKDAESYKRLVTDPVQNELNSMYEQGVDPLRNPQAGARLMSLIRSIPVDKVNMLKASAKVGEEFLKNKGLLEREGLYSEDQDAAFGALLGEWDTIGNNAVFNRPSPIKAKTLNQLIDPLVSKIKPHLLTEAEVRSRNYDYNPMYNYTGITRGDLENALVNIEGLKNDPNYPYWKEQAKRELIATGNANPSESDVINKLRQNAVDMAYQFATPLSQELDKIKLAQYEDKLARARDYQNHVYRTQEKQQSDTTNQYNFLELVKRNTVSNILGKTPQEYSKGDAKKARDAQLTFGRNVSDKYKGKSAKGIRDFINYYGNTTYDPNDLAIFTGFGYDKETGSLVMPSTKLNRLYSANSVVTHTTGYRSTPQYTDRSGLNNANTIRVTPTSRMYGAMMKDGKFKNYMEMSVQKYKASSDGTLKPDGNPEIMYYDTHITSLATNGAGSLGPQNPKIKDERTTLYNVDATAVHDSRYQDAVRGGKRVTDVYLPHTDYKDDAALTDIP